MKLCGGKILWFSACDINQFNTGNPPAFKEVGRGKSSSGEEGTE
jgi:hypothetical protein